MFHHFGIPTFLFNGKKYSIDKVLREAAAMTYEEVKQSTLHNFATQCCYYYGEFRPDGIQYLEAKPSSGCLVGIAHAVAIEYAKSKTVRGKNNIVAEYRYALGIVKTNPQYR